MKKHLLILTGLLLAVGAQVNADVPSTEEEYAPQPWNRWVCTARGHLPFRSFRGESYYFRAGSGEGQEAKRIAMLIAERECEFRTGRNCVARENLCRVERH